MNALKNKTIKFTLLGIFIAVLLSSSGCGPFKGVSIDSASSQYQADQKASVSEGKRIVGQIVPIVVSGMLVGGIDQNYQWHTAEESIDFIKSQVDFLIFSNGILFGSATGFKTDSTESIWSIDLSSNNTLPKEYLAFTSPILFLGPDKKPQNLDIAQNSVSQLLAQSNLPDVIPSVKQCYTTDLNYDRQMDMIIEASNVDTADKMAKKGTYSIILLVKSNNAEMLQIPIKQKIYTEDANQSGDLPVKYEIISIADLNFNRKKEVVIKYTTNEGFGYEIIELDGNAASVVLSAGTI